jgi:hypothetical protein
MPKFVFTNTASAQLAASLTTTDDTVQLVAGQGALFPEPGDNERAALVMRKSTGEIEIMHCTARSDDVLTVIRGQEDTTALEWDASDWISNRTTAQALNSWASADVGALAIDPMHVFADTSERDDYFIANPDELEDGIFIVLGGGFQMRADETWRNMTAVMRGEQGETGDVTQAALNAVADAETYATTVLETNALAYDPDTYFYDFPMVAVGSDGMTYRAMGDDVTALDIGDDWEASASGTSEYYYTGTNIPATQPDRVAFDGDLATEGTMGSLAAGEWDFGDNDTLGADTFYVRLGDDSDPDTKGPGFIKYRDDIDPVTGA